MNNAKRVNCGHNRRVLSNPPSIHHYLLRENATAKMKTSTHSLIGKKCMKKDIVYKAEISAKDNGQMKEYISMTFIYIYIYIYVPSGYRTSLKR